MSRAVFTWATMQVRRHPLRYGSAALIVVVLGIIGVHYVSRDKSAAAVADTGVSYVQTATVADLASATTPLSVTGKVTSLSRASILAQTSGEVVSLSHSLGDQVGAGEVIGSFEHSSQSASVLQAQGAYDAAEAAYEKAVNTTAQNSSISSASAQASAASAAAAAVNALAGAYAALDDAVHSRADQLFSNARTSNPVLVMTVPDSALVQKLQRSRTLLEAQLTAAAALPSATSADTLDAHVALMSTTAQAVVSFMNDLILAVNETQPSQVTSAATLASYQASLTAARSESVAAVSSLTAAKSAYDSAVSGASTAANSATSASGTDIASAAAYVKQALGALDAAKAALEKTIIRSPISGTIVSLPITQGGFVSAYAPVAVVSNPGALFVEVQVTPEDAKLLSVGSTALINGVERGVITFVAPALDPTTNKIEVKVGMTDATQGLTDGEVVSVALSRSARSLTQSTTAPLTIPITAVKILPTGAAVFTVMSSSTLSAIPVTLGSILGDRVVILSGLSATTTIVTDARGHVGGDTVTVAAP